MYIVPLICLWDFFIEPSYSEARSVLTSVPPTVFPLGDYPSFRASPHLAPSLPPTPQVFSFKLLGPGPKEGLLRVCRFVTYNK